MCKKMLCLSLLAFGLSTSALSYNFINTAANPTEGIYLGGQLGISRLHYSGSSYTKTESSAYDKNSPLAGKIYLGYMFSPFISTEFGYNYYGHPKFRNKDGNTQNFLQHGCSLIAKASLPLDYGFNFYLKAGLAMIHRGSLNSNNNSFVQKDPSNKVTLVGALGISYWFATNMAIDLVWDKTMKIGDLPSNNLISLGFIYKISL